MKNTRLLVVNPFPRSSRSVTRLSLALLLVFASGAASAATRTWSGAGADANWNTVANWGGTAPASGDALTFSGTTKQTNTNDISGLSLGSIVLSTANWNISGNAVTTTNFTANIAGTSTWALDTTFNTTQTLTQNVSGSVLRFAGVLSGAGGLQKVAGSSGQGSLHLLNTNNSYTGANNFFAGTTFIYSLANKGNNSSIGAGNGTINVGTTGSSFVGNLTFAGVAPGVTDRAFNFQFNPTVVGQAMNFSNNSTNNSGMTFNGAWACTPGASLVGWTLNLTGTALATNLVNVAINEGGANASTPVSLRITGPGNWVFGGNINVLGGLTITNSGVCVLKSSAALVNPPAVTVYPGSLLDVTSYDTNGTPFELGFFIPQTLTAGRTNTTGTDINGSLKLAAPSVFSGGTLNVAGLNVAGTVTISSNFIPATGSINIDLSTNDTVVGSGTNDLVKVGGNLDLSQGPANIIIKALNGTIKTNTPYTIITYTGSLIGDASGLNVPAPGRAYSSGVVSTNTPGVITVTFNPSGAANANLVWQGDGGNNYWDTQTSINWLNIGSPDFFYAGDNVTFNDSTANTSVNLSGGNSPSATTVNTTNTYSISSATGGSITGGSLTKSGTGKLIVSSANTYSGGTTVSAGTVSAGNGSALGSGAVNLGDLSSGANAISLLLTNATTLLNAVNVSSNGTGSVTLGSESSGNCAFNGAITLQRNLTFFNSNTNVNSFLVQGGISGTGDVTVAGGGFHKWQTSSCLFTGNILVTNVGTLCDINATLSSNVNVHLASGARFGDVNSPAINVLTGTGQVEPGPGLAGNSTLYIGAAGGSGTFDGFFTTNSGGFSCNLSKVGTGTITLTGDQSLSAGNTTVSNGTLIVNNSVGTGLGTGIVAVNPLGTLAGTGSIYSATHTLQVSGVLSVGNPGATTGASFTVTNSGILFNAGGALNVDLFSGAGAGDNTANSAAADVLKAQTATVVIDPTAVLNVGNPNGLTGWAIGDKWKIINWNTPAATNFNSFNLPALGVGQAWKTDDLVVDGTISVIAAVAPVSTNANLANLVVTPAGALSPVFDSNTLSYVALEAYSSSPVTVTPTTADTNATIQVIYAGVTNAVTSGSPSGSLSLDANPAVTNVVEVRVTAQDATTVKSYIVNVVRAPSLAPVSITSVVSGDSLTLGWPVDHTGYRLLVQTNNLNNGVSAKTNDWAPVSGASSTNSVTVTIDKSLRNEYFQLTYP